MTTAGAVPTNGAVMLTDNNNDAKKVSAFTPHLAGRRYREQTIM